MTDDRDLVYAMKADCARCDTALLLVPLARSTNSVVASFAEEHGLRMVESASDIIVCPHCEQPLQVLRREKS